jgi:hypothetical protein
MKNFIPLDVVDSPVLYGEFASLSCMCKTVICVSAF